MEEKLNAWTAAPVRRKTLIKLNDLRGIKKNRKKWEHTAETIDDVIQRLINFWERSHK